jgi:hypothetical protein
MSSGIRTFAQTKQTRVGTGGNGSDLYLFQESDIISACKNDGFTVLSPTMYLANSEGDLTTALTTLNGLSLPSFNDFSDIEDLGKTIRIGLLEGENIKSRIFNFEQDLWSY